MRLHESLESDKSFSFKIATSGWYDLLIQQ